jgi:hypothetical protein
MGSERSNIEQIRKNRGSNLTITKGGRGRMVVVSARFTLLLLRAVLLIDDIYECYHDLLPSTKKID